MSDRDRPGHVTFATLVRQSRTAAWLTQEELAERSGLSARTIQAIESGQVSRPHRQSVRLLADALGLSGPAQAEFEAAARRGAPRRSRRSEHRCPPLPDLATCLVHRLQESSKAARRPVDLQGLAPAERPAIVLGRLLRSLGLDDPAGAGTASCVAHPARQS